MVCYSRNNHYCIMKKPILASHNSFTYLKPKRWYMRPFNFISKCQSKTIQEQYSKYHVRIFDLRVAFDKHGDPFIRHGLMNYGYNNITEVLDWLNSRRGNVYVRVIFEISKKKNSIENEVKFMQYCEYLENRYPNIKFTTGVRKYDWRQIYKFTNELPAMDADFSSVKGSKFNDLWPWLYAKKHNKEAMKNCKSKYLMLDFIEIQ